MSLLVWISVAGCSTPKKKVDKSPEGIVGAPPSPAEDPYYIPFMPQEAVEVSTSGELIEEEESASQELIDEPDEKKSAEKKPDDKKHDENKPDDRKSDDKKKARPEVLAEQQSPAAPEATTRPVEEPPPESARPEAAQCFSCVRICPAEGSCEELKEDIICGWGTHKEAQTAQRVARAECDATLDLARQMPVWSRIEGNCPQATCR